MSTQRFTMIIDMPEGFTWGQFCQILRDEAEDWADLGGNSDEAIASGPASTGWVLDRNGSNGYGVAGEWKFEPTKTNRSFEPAFIHPEKGR